MNIIEEFKWRELLADCTDEAALNKRLSTGPITLYCGFDPTADSLHVGNLVPLLGLRRFQLCGHHPIALAGGATGLIGDPSGKTAERQLLNRERLDHNLHCQEKQLARLLDFESDDNPALMVDNARWFSEMSFLEFLRDTGKHFSVNMMVAKESVRARMEDREVGISYTEFSYMLLQAFDFHQLHQDHQCELQIGGKDQWGNITAGLDLCRKKSGAHVFGLTLPLITNADGTKFGKTEAGAVWLDPNQTSVYRFYQFWIRTLDQDVIRYLKFFTFLSREEIADLEKAHAEKPEARIAHQALAKAVTDLVHGPQATEEAIKASKILFGGGLEGISQSTFLDIAGEIPTTRVEKGRFENGPIPLVDLLVESGLCPSKGQARKDIQGGGINVNNIRESDMNRSVSTQDLLFDTYLLLRKGKKNYAVLQTQ